MKTFQNLETPQNPAHPYFLFIIFHLFTPYRAEFVLEHSLPFTMGPEEKFLAYTAKIRGLAQQNKQYDWLHHYMGDSEYYDNQLLYDNWQLKYLWPILSGRCSTIVADFSSDPPYKSVQVFNDSSLNWEPGLSAEVRLLFMTCISGVEDESRRKVVALNLFTVQWT